MFEFWWTLIKLFRSQTHVKDLGVFPRTRSLQALLRFAKENWLSGAETFMAFKLAAGRLLDTSAMVRKVALDLFECLWVRRGRFSEVGDWGMV